MARRDRFLTSVGAIDHGSVAGLGDDDHTQYLLADGSRDLTGTLQVTGTYNIDIDGSGASTAVQMAARNSVMGISIRQQATTVASIFQTSSAGAIEDEWIRFTQNGDVQLYYNDLKAAATQAAGFSIYHTSATSPALYFYSSSGTRQLFVLSQATDAIVRNETTSGRILFQAQSSGSVNRATVYMDPDAGVDLYYQGTLAMSTISGSIKFGTHTGSADKAISGYITIQDSGGTTRKLAVIT